MPSRRRALRLFGAAAVPPVLDGTRLASAPDPVEWRTAFGDGDYQFRRLVGTGDGVLALGRTGNDRSATPWLAEIGPGGEPRWTTSVDAPGFADATDAVPVDDGFAVLVTTDEHPHVRLVGLDEDGDERWRLRQEPPRNDDDHGSRHGVRNLQPTDDGFLVGGFQGNPARVDADLDAWLRAVGPDGETRWERTYDATAVGDVVPRADGFILVGLANDDAWLQPIDADGDPRWRHTYGGAGNESAGTVVPAGRGLLYAGATGSPADVSQRGMLVRTTADGTFVWRRTYDTSFVADLVPFRDGAAFTGEPPSADRSGRNPDKPVVLVDRWGRVRERVTLTVPVGEPGGLARFPGDGLAVGGWSSVEGLWLAKLDPDS